MINTNNNEILGAIAFQEVLKHSQILSITKCLLILPLLLDKKIRNKLKNKSLKVMSSQDICISYMEEFSNIPNNFEHLLITSLNTITVSLELGICQFSEGRLAFKTSIFDNISVSNTGKHAADIHLAAQNVSKLLNDSESDLYHNFRIAP